MSIPVVAFFNNKGGVGKTSMVYHLAWMFAERGLAVVAVDLDPQCNLTAACVTEDRLEQLMGDGQRRQTVFGALEPLKRGIGDIEPPHVEMIAETLGLVPGDMALSTWEDDLSQVWPKCLDGDERSFRVISAFYRIAQLAGKSQGADAVLVDLGPNLGAINRAALIGSDYIVIPLGPDLFSVQGLTNLGPALRTWRAGWQERLAKKPATDLELPPGRIEPIGYLVLRHTIRLDRPVQAFERWIARMPEKYAQVVLNQTCEQYPTVDKDPHCLARVKDYRSLMPLAQEARKPMFLLKPADGALGAHGQAVQDAYRDFEAIAVKIAASVGLKPLS
jgi:chromosome partitioning protein